MTKGIVSRKNPDLKPKYNPPKTMVAKVIGRLYSLFSLIFLELTPGERSSIQRDDYCRLPQKSSFQGQG